MEKKEISQHSNFWSEEDANFALRHYGPMSAREIGEKIGRSESAVRKFIKRYDESRGAR